MAVPKRSKLGAAFRAAERLSNPVQNLAGAGQPVTDAAKSKLYEIGTEGSALIVKAPGTRRVSRVQENVGRFTVRVELPGETPYEQNVWQSFWGPEWDLLQPGTTVVCRVDPAHRDRVLLLVAETDETRAATAPRSTATGLSFRLRAGRFGRRTVESSEIAAEGRPAVATVLSCEATGETAPGTDDPVFTLRLEVRADEEPQPWEVEFPQRVPLGFEGSVSVGSKLAATYTGVNDPDRVALDLTTLVRHDKLH